jgi:cytochrome c-type biogenesis protein CcmH
MMGFALGATLLVAITVLLLLLPFRQRHQEARRASADFSRKQINAAIYRDELVELENDRAEGSLAQADYEQARTELQRRLIEDSSVADGVTLAAPVSHAVPLALALSLALGAVLLYLALGNPAALNPPPPEQKMTAGDIERMVAGLAAKLENEPGNLQGWAMLARSYKAMGRLPDALRAYERVGSLMEGNPDLLLDYADALAASHGGFNEKARALIDQALKIDPAHPQGLWLRGTVYYNLEQYAKAQSDWEALLKLLPPDSEDAAMLQANLAEVRQLQGAVAPRP